VSFFLPFLWPDSRSSFSWLFSIIYKNASFASKGKIIVGGLVRAGSLAIYFQLNRLFLLFPLNAIFLTLFYFLFRIIALRVMHLKVSCDLTFSWFWLDLGSFYSSNRLKPRSWYEWTAIYIITFKISIFIIQNYLIRVIFGSLNWLFFKLSWCAASLIFQENLIYFYFYCLS